MMDLKLVSEHEMKERWPALELIAATRGVDPRTKAGYPIAVVDPDGDSETIFIRCLDEKVAHRTLAHEANHVILLRIGEREAAHALDYQWVKRRLD